MKKHNLLIPSAKASSIILSVTSPWSGKVIAECETVDIEAVDIAHNNAHEVFADKSQHLSIYQRIEILTKTADIMQSRFNELVQDATNEGGKPLMDSKVEVARAIDGVKNCIEILRTQHGEEIPMNLNPASSGRVAFTQYEPIGTVVAVSAFNHPLNLIIHQVAPAVAVGCPVIIKPAGDTPLSCINFIKILHEAGLPEKWAQVFITKDRKASTSLVTDKRTAFFGFIGSGKVGWSLKSQLSPGTRCALEHGGVAPVIFCEDADIKKAAPLLVKGGLYHAGQVCVSVQRIYAHSSVAEKLTTEIAKLAKLQKVGDPLSAETQIGPLIRPSETSRIHEWVMEACQDKNTKLICGGKPFAENPERAYEPTVIWNPPKDSKVSQLEVFGPVICIYPFDDLDSAIKDANSLPFSFQAAAFTSNINTSFYCYKNLSAAAVMINDHTAFRVDWMPFAGYKESGYGIGGIPHTMQDMQIKKLLVINTN